MKILYSHYGLYRKNGWGRTFEFARAMVELGHEVTILCSSPGLRPFFDIFEEDGVKVVEFGDFFPVKMISSGYGLLSLINRILYCLFHHFDICHSDSHRDCGYIPCVFNRLIYHSKLVIDWWDNFEEKVYASPGKNRLARFLNKRDLKKEISTKRKANGVVVLSQMLYDRAIDRNVESDKLLILHGGCDIEHLAFLPFNEGKQLLGLSNEVLTFGLIGMGDAEYEDIKILLDALLDCAENNKVKFINFGKPIIKNLSKVSNMKSVLIEGGWIDYYNYKDASKLCSVDVFVLTKQDNIINNSGWPTKIGDYLACGRPIMLNLYGELISFNEKFKPGFIIVKNQKDSITSAIMDIINGKYDIQEMGKNNRDIALKNSWLVKAKELESFYYKCYYHTR